MKLLPNKGDIVLCNDSLIGFYGGLCSEKYPEVFKNLRNTILDQILLYPSKCLSGVAHYVNTETNFKILAKKE